MLSVDLLRVRIRKGVARPAYLTPDDAAVVREVLGAFSSAVAGSWRYAELEERISQLSGIYDRRLVRGLSSLMERRLTLSQASGISPVELRKLLFSMGPVISREERDALIASVASKFNASVDEVERAIFSDVEREKIVSGLEALGPGDLIAWYNAELTETLIARSVSLRISAARLWSAILRRIKRLGLMYEVIEDAGGTPSIEVTGPASVLGIHDRYSRAASGLVPVLLDVGEWRMDGRIRLGTREMEFSVDSSSAEMRYPPDVIGRSIRTFDSSMEERLYRALLQAAPDLRVLREPAPLDAGSGVMVPDFAVDVDGHRVFIEVVGFWTPEYLRRKVEKLRRVRGADMILLVDGSIRFPRADVPSEVIFYHGNDIPLKHLLASIRGRTGRSLDAAAVQSAGVSGPPIAGLDSLLEGLVDATFDEVERKLRPILGEDWFNAMESMGYYFEWGSLDVRDARLRRRE